MAGAGVLAALGACGVLGGGRPAETPQQAAAREEADARIRREVEARLAAEPAVGAGRIRVDVVRGEVRLHGTAPGFGALRCAIRNAELTPGVQLVIDFLVLEPGPSTVRCIAPRVFPAS
ncbi:MAG TPA: BON domain-containing protein [Longimicrobium sp.]|nr:BON domain-containing protein [Longimicrobium sp.]